MSGKIIVNPDMRDPERYEWYVEKSHLKDAVIIVAAKMHQPGQYSHGSAVCIRAPNAAESAIGITFEKKVMTAIIECSDWCNEQNEKERESLRVMQSVSAEDAEAFRAGMCHDPKAKQNLPVPWGFGVIIGKIRRYFRRKS